MFIILHGSVIASVAYLLSSFTMMLPNDCPSFVAPIAGGKFVRVADFFLQSNNEDACTTCKDGGLLFCCETCPRSYHCVCREPIDPSMEDEPFFCSVCKSNHPEQGECNIVLNLRLDTSKATFGHFELGRDMKHYFNGIHEAEGGKFSDQLAQGPK